MYNIFNNKIQNKNSHKKAIFLSILLIFICIGLFFSYYKYNKFINSFKNNFNDYKFSEANNILLTEQNFNIFKSLFINKDISLYFNNEIINISKEIENKTISSENALIKINEICRYNIVAHDELHNISSSIDLIKDSNQNYNNGVNSFNNGNYEKAISYFQKVSPLDLDYQMSLIYLTNSKDKIKNELLSYCDNLVSNNYYTEALAKISDTSTILGDDANIKDKILEIKAKQKEYLDSNSAIAEASSHALTTNISPNNINTLNIESATSYLINVSLENQKTYIYFGKPDNWKLLRTCPCSTGINGEETPAGSFSTKEKGNWFFSDKYEQGGKYWTQITGDILFHSIPFAKDKTTVLDYTLNKPSSHGCIRLSIEDAQWIYNNIPKGSKVIIK
ncbi:L,D-transpeptidase [Clostridium sp. C2-6-12]|uniref:L,D-transpeptidase n=1 Tax=Clostridium sp. C2-6-12 TaxID=2698832 RepID=UPI00136CA11E|nr:L,D-transpeptidase [Clostridium sp. C2-6-12]